MQKMSYNENQMEDVMKKIKIVAISVGIICAIAIGLIFFYFDGQRTAAVWSWVDKVIIAYFKVLGK